VGCACTHASVAASHDDALLDGWDEAFLYCMLFKSFIMLRREVHDLVLLSFYAMDAKSKVGCS
jgi:hypothetical protein